MNKLLNRSLRQLLIYVGVVLIFSVPVYYFIISKLWEYELDEHNIILTDAADREDTFLIIGAVTLLTVLFFVLLLGGFILLNRRISKRLWQPFYQSLNKIKNFKLGQQGGIAFDSPDIIEFAELNQSLDKLITGNITVYTQQKEFAENASHELQTPLAIIQSKLELLLQSSALQDDQYDIIEEALTALARVARINKNLLLLTRIENSQYMDKERVNLSELLETNILLFAHFAEDKQLEFAKNIEMDVISEGNKILIEILINNLMTNAIRYSPVNTTINLGLSKSGFSISNKGAKALLPDQLFKRFSVGSTESPGTGLGLALVKEISGRYGWKTSYAYILDQHVFTIHF